MRANTRTEAECRAVYDSRNSDLHDLTFHTYQGSAPEVEVGPCILFIGAYSTFAAGDMLWSNDDNYFSMCNTLVFPSARCLCLAPPSTPPSPATPPPALPPPPSPSPPVPLTPDVALVHALRDGSWKAVLDVAADTLTNVYLLDQGERGPVVAGDLVVYASVCTMPPWSCAASGSS